jgi:hypothetical protein
MSKLRELAALRRSQVAAAVQHLARTPALSKMANYYMRCFYAPEVGFRVRGQALQDAPRALHSAPRLRPARPAPGGPLRSARTVARPDPAPRRRRPPASLPTPRGP